MKCNKCTCFIYDLIESRIIYKKKETIEIIHDIINICDEILKSFEGFLPMFNGQSEDLILMMIEDDDDFINIVESLFELAGKKGILVCKFRPWFICLITDIISNIYLIHSEHTKCIVSSKPISSNYIYIE